MKILVGDVGGTKTILAVAECVDGRIRIIRRKRFESARYKGLAPMVLEFLDDEKEKYTRACFGVASPVDGERCAIPNLFWSIDRRELVDAISIPHTTLINDFCATGYGIEHLGPDDRVLLKGGTADPNGPIALLGAGTGLGETFLIRDEKGLRVLPTEGGHADFAPRNEIEFGLLLFMGKRLNGRVSVERILSGSGLSNIYDYLIEQGMADENRDVRERMCAEDPAAVISDMAMKESDSGCSRALDLFVSIYGAEAGNQALRILATGGVCIGGGIAPKILDRMKSDIFVDAFLDKGRFAGFLDRIPIEVIVSESAPLYGAFSVAGRGSLGILGETS